MKPAPFDYLAPTSLADAVEALGSYGADAKVLAGGQSLVPVMAMRLSRFDHLIDLNRIPELDFVRHDETAVVIGAMTRESRVGADTTIAENVPLLTDATQYIGHFQIRNRGTLGGSLAHADPAAEYPAVAMALDATMHLVGPDGSRSVSAEGFFLGPMMCCVEDEELLHSVSFPVWGAGSGFSVQEFARRAGDFATAGVAVGIRVADGNVDKASIAFFGMASSPVRARELEAELVGQKAMDLDFEELGNQAVAHLEPPDDIHASSSLRRRIGAQLAHRALSSAVKEAT
jgi:carbon-monoxide dehydrogenase medium subunit